MSQNNISLKNITVTYPDFQLKDVSFDVPKGEVVGFVGENGAGKTTTIKALLNLSPIVSGSISVFDENALTKNTQIKEDIGVVLDDAYFYEDFLVSEIEAVMKKVYKKWDSPYFNQLLKDHNIDRKKPFKECSKGMQAKVKIFAALAHHPRLLLLDEPTTGLDPVSRDDILSLFYDFVTDETSILFSSHITSDIDKIADRIVFIHQGEIILETTQNELDESFGLVKLSKDDFQDMDMAYFLSYQINSYNVTCLVDDKQRFLREFPDFVVEPVTVETILLMLKKGERNR